MGRSKAELPFRGTTLLNHSIATLRSAGFTASVAGLPPGAFAAPDTPCVPDRYPGAGPLAGIEAALHSLQAEPPQPVQFVPVDLPLLPPHFLRTLFERALHTGALATVPFSTGRPQPLCAVYVSSLAPGLCEALARNDRKVMRVLRELAPGAAFDAFPVEALAPLHGWTDAHRWFTNLNTPADWAAFADGPSRASTAFEDSRIEAT